MRLCLPYGQDAPGGLAAPLKHSENVAKSSMSTSPSLITSKHSQFDPPEPYGLDVPLC